MCGCFSSITRICCRPRGELADGVGIPRQRHLHLEDADAERADRGLVLEPEPAERLAHLPQRDARRDDADPCVGRVGDHTVESVRARVFRGDDVADLVDLAFEVQSERREQAALGEPLVAQTVGVGDHRLHAIRVEIHRRGPVGDVGDDLHRGPQAARARERHRVPPEVEHLGRVAGVEQRHVEVLEDAGRRRRDRRALRGRVVAREGDRAAVLRRAGVHRVAHRVGGAVDAGCLAVPDAEHAVVAMVGLRGRELRAHHRGGRVLLVHRGPAHDRQIGRQLRGLTDGDVEAAERGARVAGDERGGAQPGATVGAQLVDREAGEGLDPAQEHGAAVGGEPVGESVVRSGHATSASRCATPAATVPAVSGHDARRRRQGNGTAAPPFWSAVHRCHVVQPTRMGAEGEP